MLLILSVATLCTPNTHSLAQTAKSGQKGAKIADSTLDPRLESTPLEADALGLRMHLPAGAAVVAEKSNGQLTLSVSDDPATPTWTLRIQMLVSTLTHPTASAQIDDLMREFAQTRQSVEVISNEQFQAGSRQGQLCYIKRKLRGDQQVIAGWLLLPTGANTFMVFTMQTLPEHMPRMQPILETSFKTIELRNSDELSSERKSQLEAGREFIASITPDKLRSVIGLKQSFRIYSPAGPNGAGETEHGYSLLEVLEAKRGALNPERAESTYDTSERKAGIMIRVQGRIAIQPERDLYYDSIALYWMAWDQSEEAWSIRGTQRQGEAEQSEAETAVRTPYSPGGPPPHLTVIKADRTSNSREPYEWEIPEVYLSQPLGWLIGRLLPRNVTEPVELKYYSYNFANRKAQISLRTDQWSRATDGAAGFQLLTTLASDTPAITSLYSAQGDLIRRVHPDGSVTEPATLENIRKIWKGKGLNTGTSSR